jgi:hypothetical protein
VFTELAGRVRICANKVGAGVRCGACLLKIRLVNTRQFAPLSKLDFAILTS